MNKKELVFPGIILGIVLVIAVALILTLPKSTTGLPSSDMASSTGTSTTTAPTGGSMSGGSSAPTSYYPYGTITLSIGEVAGFKDGLSVRPTNVIEDSRCPVEAQCIQAGTVRITLKTSVKEVATTQTVTLGKSVTVNGDRITFTDVSPSRSKEGAPAFNSYRLTFTVEPAGTAGGGTGTKPPGPCYVGGCSREVCSDQESQVSTCIYRAEYACYKKATCERQTSGSCGWTQTSELKACLANPPAIQ